VDVVAEERRFELAFEGRYGFVCKNGKAL